MENEAPLSVEGPLFVCEFSDDWMVGRIVARGVDHHLTEIVYLLRNKAAHGPTRSVTDLGPGKGPGSSFKHPSTRNIIQQ